MKRRAQSWAEILDLDVEWDGGAPLPHVVSDAATSIVVCRAEQRNSAWDGTTVRVVSASDDEAEPLLVFTFTGCRSIRFGLPDVDVLRGLRIEGVQPWRAHRVHESAWLAELNRIESVHPTPSPVEGVHYLFSFHDDLFEAVAQGFEVTRVRSTIRDALRDAVERLTH